MGCWNDWYQYRCAITEDDVLANAKALISSRLDHARVVEGRVHPDDDADAAAVSRGADGLGEKRGSAGDGRLAEHLRGNVRR